MTITITLPPDTEKRLKLHAGETGKDVSEVVCEAVEARLATSGKTLREILAPVHDQTRQCGISDPEIDALLKCELTGVRADRKGKPENGK
jgi:hypothetical protein